MPKRDRWSSDEEEDGQVDGQVVASQLQPSGDGRAPSGQRAAGGRRDDESLPHDASPSSSPRRKAAAATAIELPPGFRLHNPLLDGCRSVYDSYERLSHLDEGTYGVVWKARDDATGEIVALKQIKFDDPELTREGFPISALREIGVLLSLSHECVVTVREMVVGSSPDKVYMVMECMETDLQAAMSGGGKATSPFAQSEVKFMMHQILSAMSHVHDRWFVHRDVKTSNVLVHKTGRIAMCDFGLARRYEVPHRNMTQMVVTLWYRSPELLFGESVYGPEIDMWR